MATHCYGQPSSWLALEYGYKPLWLALELPWTTHVPVVYRQLLIWFLFSQVVSLLGTRCAKPYNPNPSITPSAYALHGGSWSQALAHPRIMACAFVHLDE